MSNFVKLHELMNTCVMLSQRAGTIIRNIRKEGTLNIVQKGICSQDVYTEADLRIQKTLHHNLSALYPTAKIICEEDHDQIPDHIQPCMQPDTLLKMIKKQAILTPEILATSAKLRRVQYLHFLNELLEFNYDFLNTSDVHRALDNSFQNEYPERELTFWVDPLDGSSGLAEGHTEHLTCIIGVSINRRPLMGVVHKPFVEDENPNIRGKTYVGLPQSGLFAIDHYLRANDKSQDFLARYMPPFRRDQNLDRQQFKPRVCGSHNKNQSRMDKILYSMQPERIERVAGAGNKFVNMVEGETDFYINLVPGFKHWDMCGSEAILLSRFGIVTDAQKKPLYYDSEQNHTIREGIIAAKNKKVYEFCQHKIEESTGISLEMNHQLVIKEADELKRIRKITQELSKPVAYNNI